MRSLLWRSYLRSLLRQPQIAIGLVLLAVVVAAGGIAVTKRKAAPSFKSVKAATGQLLNKWAGTVVGWTDALSSRAGKTGAESGGKAAGATAQGAQSAKASKTVKTIPVGELAQLPRAAKSARIPAAADAAVAAEGANDPSTPGTQATPEAGPGGASVSEVRSAEELPADPSAAIGSSGQGTALGCSSAEYRGAGAEYVEMSPKDWALFMDTFHAVKRDLGQWLERRRAELPPATYQLMLTQASELRAHRPPAPQSPDLTWRGIAVLVDTGGGNPGLRIGTGFIQLLRKEPRRAKFELTRLVAQTWAPCELKRNKVEDVWQPLLACLGIHEPRACGEGTFSEGAWGVSSSVAYAISPPDCVLPVFKDPRYAACLNGLKTGSLRSLASVPGGDK